MDTKQFIGWVVFNILMAPILYIRPEGMRFVVLVMNIISAITLICIMIYLLSAAGGGGPLLTEPSSVRTGSELGWTVVYGITTVIGGIAVGLTNQMDYSRFARRPGDQVMGQWISIIGFGAVGTLRATNRQPDRTMLIQSKIMPLFGTLSASATQALYGEAIWNPPDIVQKWLDTDYNAKSRAAGFFAGCGLVVCQLAINTIDNAFSTGMDMAGLVPSFINIRRGAYIGLILSIAMCPWQLLASASVFISVLSAYSVFLGPMVGIYVCEYWFLRQRKVKLSDLYHPRPDGIYHYWHGVNWRSFTSWTIGWSYLIPGFAATVTPDAVQVPQACINLYYLAFPLGFTVSFLVHLALNRIWPPVGLGDKDDIDYYGTFTTEEAVRLGVAPNSPIEGEDEASETTDPAAYGKSMSGEIVKSV